MGKGRKLQAQSILACVYGIRMFRPYLHGRNFVLHTDHQPLVHLMRTAEPTGQQQRWILILMEHDFEIQHVFLPFPM